MPLVQRQGNAESPQEQRNYQKVQNLKEAEGHTRQDCQKLKVQVYNTSYGHCMQQAHDQE
jgi:hypothetical protein